MRKSILLALIVSNIFFCAEARAGMIGDIEFTEKTKANLLAIENLHKLSTSRAIYSIEELNVWVKTMAGITASLSSDYWSDKLDGSAIINVDESDLWDIKEAIDAPRVNSKDTEPILK